MNATLCPSVLGVYETCMYVFELPLYLIKNVISLNIGFKKYPSSLLLYCFDHCRVYCIIPKFQNEKNDSVDTNSSNTFNP